MKKSLKVIGIVIIVAGVIGIVISEMNAGTYNDYIMTVRPSLAAQDKLAMEVQQAAKTSDKEVAANIDGFIARSEALEQELKKATPKDPELAALHQHMVTRAATVTAYLQALKTAVKNQKKADVEAATALAAKAGEHLTAFKAARDAYGKKHSITFDD